MADAPEAPTAWQGWARIFNLPARDSVGMHRRIALLVALPDEVEQAFVHLDQESRGLWLRHLPAVRESFSRFPQAGSIALSTFRSGLSGEVLYSVEAAATVLRARWTAVLPEQDTLDTVTERLLELLREVRLAEDLDEEMREFLTRQLSALLRGVQTVKVGGRAAMEDALDVVVGALVRRSDITVRAPETAPGIWQRFGTAVAGFALVLEVSLHALGLPAAVRDAIAPPEDKPAVVVVVDGEGTAAVP